MPVAELNAEGSGRVVDPVHHPEGCEIDTLHRISFIGKVAAPKRDFPVRARACERNPTVEQPETVVAVEKGRVPVHSARAK